MHIVICSSAMMISRDFVRINFNIIVNVVANPHKQQTASFVKSFLILVKIRLDVLCESFASRQFI